MPSTSVPADAGDTIDNGVYGDSAERPIQAVGVAKGSAGGGSDSVAGTAQGASPIGALALLGPGSLMESLITGTGFDIAMVQNGLLPLEEQAVEEMAAESAVEGQVPLISGVPQTDFVQPGDAAAYAADAVDQTWLMLAMGG